jgi:hypothetical protein
LAGKVTIAKYLQGGVTLKELDDMPYHEYLTLAQAVNHLLYLEKKEMEKVKK